MLFVPLRVVAEDFVEGLLEPSATAGTLIAAALESAGYMALTVVLEDLSGTIGALAALIFGVVMAIGLYRLATGGDIGPAVWMLIGPPTFYFLINAHVNAAGSTWQFGTFDGKKDLEVFVGENEGDKTPKVPWIFHRFNVLTSSLIQELVKVITSYDSSDMLQFMVRPAVSDDITNARIGSPELSSLIQFSTARCSSSLEKVPNLIGSIAAGTKNGEMSLVNPTPSQASGIEEIKRAFAVNNVSLQSGGYLNSLVNTAAKIKEDQTSRDGRLEQLRPYHQCIEQYVNGRTFTAGEVVSCATLWCMVGVGANYEAEAVIEQAKKNIPPEASEVLVTKVMNEIRSKLTHDKTYGEVSLEESLTQLRYIVSGQLVKNFLATTDHSAYMAQLSDKWRVSTSAVESKPELTLEDQHAMGREYRNEQLSRRESMQIYVFAQLLPYFQGMILYILAISYPFVALLILIPERASTFFAWFGAWVWAKSWDLGWAVVMVIEDLLWQFLPLDSIGQYSDLFDPVVMFDQAQTSTHKSALATYYVLLSMMMTSVPILTGKVLLGRHAAFAQTIVSGIKKISDAVGEKVARRTAIGQMRDITTQKVAGFREFESGALQAAFAGTYDAKSGDYLDSSGNVIPLSAEQKSALQNLRENTSFSEALHNIRKTEANAEAMKQGATAAGGFFAALATKGIFSGAAGAATAGIAKGLGVKYGLWPALDKQRSIALNVQRAANAAEADLMRATREFLYYEYGYTSQIRAFEGVRAAITSRVEYPNAPDAPISALVTFDNLAQANETALMALYGDMVGGGIGTGMAARDTKTVLQRKGP